MLIFFRYTTGLADKSEQQVNPNGSLVRAFLDRFQSIWFHNMKDRHHFNLLTKAGFKIRSFNRFPMLLSLPVQYALRKTAGDDFCAMTSSLELWDRKGCQTFRPKAGSPHASSPHIRSAPSSVRPIFYTVRPIIQFVRPNILECKFAPKCQFAPKIPVCPKQKGALEVKTEKSRTPVKTNNNFIDSDYQSVCPVSTVTNIEKKGLRIESNKHSCHILVICHKQLHQTKGCTWSKNWKKPYPCQNQSGRSTDLYYSMPA